MSDRITLVIDRRDMTLRMDNKALRIDITDGDFKRVPISLLEQVIIYGSPAIRCDVWRALSEHNVPAAILPSRGRGSVSWLGSGLSSFVQYRMSQHAVFRDPIKRITMARWVLKEKFKCYQYIIGTDERSKKYLTQLRQADNNLYTCDNISQLMGVEGAVARLGIAWLKERIHKRWMFEGRNRRPPQDPVNALLSLGYTLALAEARGQASAAGLDANLGFLHEPAPARESLALDLIEPLRAGVDAFVLSLLDTVLTPKHFTFSISEGSRMNKEARSLFYAAWNLWVKDWPLQAEESSEVKTLTQINRNFTLDLRAKLTVLEGSNDHIV